MVRGRLARRTVGADGETRLRGVRVGRTLARRVRARVHVVALLGHWWERSNCSEGNVCVRMRACVRVEVHTEIGQMQGLRVQDGDEVELQMWQRAKCFESRCLRKNGLLLALFQLSNKPFVPLQWSELCQPSVQGRVSAVFIPNRSIVDRN